MRTMNLGRGFAAYQAGSLSVFLLIALPHPLVAAIAYGVVWGETAATALPLTSLRNAFCTMATKKTQAPFFTRRRPNSRGWPQPSYAKNATLKQWSPVIAFGGINISSIDGLAIF
jgi:hypothetical protein